MDSRLYGGEVFDERLPLSIEQKKADSARASDLQTYILPDQNNPWPQKYLEWIWKDPTVAISYCNTSNPCAQTCKLF